MLHPTALSLVIATERDAGAANRVRIFAERRTLPIPNTSTPLQYVRERRSCQWVSYTCERVEIDSSLPAPDRNTRALRYTNDKRGLYVSDIRSITYHAYQSLDRQGLERMVRALQHF
jgi:hypothetical protein